MDCIHYKVRKDGRILNRAAYIVFGITAERYKDILSITVGANKTSKFCLGMINDMKKHGVQDVLVFCVDGLNRFKKAIGAFYLDVLDTKMSNPYTAQLFQICQLQWPKEILFWF